MTKRKSKVSATTTVGGAAGLTPDSVTVDQLSAAIGADRLARRMAWPAYAAFLGVPQATVYKIFRKTRKRPHQTTIAQILDTIQGTPVQRNATGTQTGVRPSGTDDEPGASVPVVREGRQD